jgi:putative flippase GtrA
LGLRDWRISALATLFANLTNYVLNNAWTFVDRGHRGWSLVRGYATYLGFSLVGMLASTLTFAGLTSAYHNFLHTAQGTKEPYLMALGFQFVAILAGTVFNYELNKRFTWRDKNSSESKTSGAPWVQKGRAELESASLERDAQGAAGQTKVNESSVNGFHESKSFRCYPNV